MSKWIYKDSKEKSIINLETGVEISIYSIRFDGKDRYHRVALEVGGRKTIIKSCNGYADSECKEYFNKIIKEFNPVHFDVEKYIPTEEELKKYEEDKKDLEVMNICQQAMFHSL